MSLKRSRKLARRFARIQKKAARKVPLLPFSSALNAVNVLALENTYNVTVEEIRAAFSSPDIPSIDGACKRLGIQTLTDYMAESGYQYCPECDDFHEVCPHISSSLLDDSSHAQRI
jgi:hypothetical protein